MITTTGLTKSYGDTAALEGISFTAPRGQVTAVVGPNGSGKSSLLRIISGVAKQDSGDVFIDGRPIQEFSTLGTTLGFYIDGIGVHPTWQVSEQLSILTPLVAKSDNSLREISMNYGLAQFEHLRGRELSAGMRGRTGIAMSLRAEPEHVILDEPANGLDPQSIQWLRQLIRDKARSGGAVIFSSHLMSEVEDVADRIVVLFQGRILWDSTLEELVRARSRLTVCVEGNNLPALQAVLENQGVKYDRVEDTLHVYNIERAEVGFLAHHCGCVVTGLREENLPLEQIYIAMLEEAANDINTETTESHLKTQLIESKYAQQLERDCAITDETLPEPVSRPYLRGFTQKMRGNLLSEFRRFRAYRPLPWMLVGLAVFSFAMSFLVRHSTPLSHAETTALLSVIYTGASTIPYLSAFIGVYSVTTDLESGFGRHLYGSWGHREFAVIAKLLTVTILASVFAQTSIVFGAMGTLAADGWHLWPAEYWLSITLHAASTTVASCGFGLMGAAVGFLTRRFHYGMLVLVILFIIVPVLTAQLLRISTKLLALAQLLPLAAGNTFVDPMSNISFLSATALFAWTFGLVLAALTAMQHADL